MKNTLLLAVVALAGCAAEHTAMREATGPSRESCIEAGLCSPGQRESGTKPVLSEESPASGKASGPCDFALECANNVTVVCEKAVLDKARFHPFVSECSPMLAARCDEGSRTVMMFELEAWVGVYKRQPDLDSLEHQAEEVLLRAVAACPSGDAVYELLVTHGDRFAAFEPKLSHPSRETATEVEWLRSIAGLPKPNSIAEAARDKAEARQREADGHVLAARAALAAAKYDEAVREADAAEQAGAAIANIRQEISSAKEAASQQHQKRAHEFVTKNDPDAALEEVEKAEALTGDPSLLSDLRQVIAKTPKALHREALRKEEARRKERRQVAARRETCRTIRASVSDVPHRRALQVASVFTTGRLDPYQRTVNLVNAIDVMGHGSSVYAQDALGRVDADVMLAAVRGGASRSHAALGISRDNLVQQRDKVFYSLLNRVIAEPGQLSGRVREQVQNAASFPDYLLASKGNFTAYTTIVAASIPDLPEKVFRAAVAEMYCTAPSNFVER